MLELIQLRGEILTSLLDNNASNNTNLIKHQIKTNREPNKKGSLIINTRREREPLNSWLTLSMEECQNRLGEATSQVITEPVEGMMRGEQNQLKDKVTFSTMSRSLEENNTQK